MALSYRLADDAAPLAEINTTPLVDVMLVLLIIFLITIPAALSSVQLNLPKESSTLRETSPQTLVISVDKTGQIYWHDTPIQTTELKKRLNALKNQARRTELHIRGDAQTHYQHIGFVVQAARSAGIASIGFITEPSSQ